MNERFEAGQPASQPEIIAQFAQVQEACERLSTQNRNVLWLTK